MLQECYSTTDKEYLSEKHFRARQNLSTKRHQGRSALQIGDTSAFTGRVESGRAGLDLEIYCCLLENLSAHSDPNLQCLPDSA